MIRIMEKMVRRIGYRIDDKSNFLTEKLINGCNIDIFVVFDTVMQDARDDQVDVTKPFGS